METMLNFLDKRGLYFFVSTGILGYKYAALLITIEHRPPFLVELDAEVYRSEEI